MSQQPGTHEQLLLNNHLAFLASHRGYVAADRDSFLITSERSEFTIVIAGSSIDVKEYTKSFTRIQLAPWAQSQKNILTELGWVSQGTISYMELGQTAHSFPSPRDIQIKRVESTEAMRDFCEIQSRGFLETKEDFDSWHPWLSAANFKNLDNQNQHFLVGYRDGAAVGVTLLLIENGVAGIYAVATPPEYRKNGISTAILNEAIRRAKNQECSYISLQVRKNSYAESLYKKLGFKSVFELEVFATPEPPKENNP